MAGVQRYGMAYDPAPRPEWRKQAGSALERRAAGRAGGPSALARDAMRSLLVPACGAVGFAVGLVMWGSILSAIVSEVEGVFDDFAAETSNEQPATDVEAVDCDAFGPQRALSQEDEAAYQAQCLTATPEITVTPTPEPTRAPTDENRFNCARIRGTDYRSQEERSWFLANCLTPTP